jgi:ABC-type transport system involved in multi-copper enzyme maturation permease subunit
MRNVLVIARASLREHSRRRLLLAFAIGTALVTGVSIYLLKDVVGQAIIGERSRAALQLSNGIFSLFALIGALAVSMGNIGQAFASGEAIGVLARPVARWEYTLGRLGGSIGAIAGFCLLCGIETQVIQAFAGGGLVDSVIWRHWGVEAFNLVVVAAIATLLSVFMANAVVAAVVTFFINQLVATVASFHRFIEVARSGAVVPAFARSGVARAISWLWYVTPKSLASPLAGRLLPPEARDRQGTLARAFLPHNTFGLTVWAIAYLLAIVALAIFMTDRKEI